MFFRPVYHFGLKYLWFLSKKFYFVSQIQGNSTQRIGNFQEIFPIYLLFSTFQGKRQVAGAENFFGDLRNPFEPYEKTHPHPEFPNSAPSGSAGW